MKKIILFSIYILSQHVLFAQPLEMVKDIYNIDLNNFCEASLQFKKVESNGVVERGCLNKDGELNGIWLRQFKDRSLRIKLYRNGEVVKHVLGPHSKAQDVSIISLIATPDKYVGKNVRIIGYYFNPHFEISGISMNHLDHKFSGSKNSIWIKLPKYLRNDPVRKKVNNKYVIIEGVFSKSNGHMGQYSGTIDLINRIEPLDSLNKELEKETKK